MRKILVLGMIVSSVAIAEPKQSGPFNLPSVSVSPGELNAIIDTSILPGEANYNITCNLSDPTLKSKVIVSVSPESYAMDNLQVYFNKNEITRNGWGYQLDLITTSEALLINNFYIDSAYKAPIVFRNFDTTETVSVQCTADFA